MTTPINYDRYFIFGCSWTKYYWPTWADIIALATDRPVHNLGRPGIGNMGILCRLAEFDAQYKFTDRDAIIVQWSSWTREDRYKDHWRFHGNIFNNPFYDKTFVRKYWSWENDIIKNSTAILTANRAYNIPYQFNMFPYLEMESGIPHYLGFLNSPYEGEYTYPIAEYWVPHLPQLDCWPMKSNTQFNDNCSDGHPDIASHLAFFDNYISDKFNLDLGDNRDMLHKMQQDISNKVNKNMDYQKTQITIVDIIKKYIPSWDFNLKGIP
jgi:hypothetical protein